MSSLVRGSAGGSSLAAAEAHRVCTWCSRSWHRIRHSWGQGWPWGTARIKVEATHTKCTREQVLHPAALRGGRSGGAVLDRGMPGGHTHAFLATTIQVDERVVGITLQPGQAAVHRGQHTVQPQHQEAAVGRQAGSYAWNPPCIWHYWPCRCRSCHRLGTGHCQPMEHWGRCSSRRPGQCRHWGS